VFIILECVYLAFPEFKRKTLQYLVEIKTMMSHILHREDRRVNEFELGEAMSTCIQFKTFEEKLADVAFRRKLVNNLQIFTDSMAFHMYNFNI
jgi:hypothetical protein